ncbi:MAG TPA: hypothetical protein PLU10_11360 [Chitinophagaceae bacterium]|nr:hypothetical protein [Chitinophagaceae bacterium]
MKSILIFLLSLVCLQATAGDDPKALIRELNRKFNLVNDYTASLYMKFDVPGVKLSSMHGRVLFKRPNKFRIKAKGIFFLPKQNPMQQVSSMLLDTSAYTTVISGYELLNGKSCAIVNIIPVKNDQELVLGKFWIDTKNILILKSQMTSRNNGTIETLSEYGANSTYALPDKMTIQIEMKKMKVPKMMAVDLNKKSKEVVDPNKLEKGRIDLFFTNYNINTRLSDDEFKETKE